MMRVGDLIAAIGPLERAELEAWVRAEWVRPEPGHGETTFSERECARIRLICTLRIDLGIDAETLPLVLSLVDQLYDTRRKLLALTEAVAAQDAGVRSAVLKLLAKIEAEAQD